MRHFASVSHGLALACAPHRGKDSAMILSYRHRFILLRAYKVAGTSVEMALSTLCGDRDVVSPMMPVDEAARQQMGGFCGNYGADPAVASFYNQAVQTADFATLEKLRPPPGTYGAHSTLAEIVAQSGIDPVEFRALGIARNPYARLISLLHMTAHLGDYRRGTAMPEATEGLAEAFERSRQRDGLARLHSAAIFAGATPELLRFEHLHDDLAAFAASLRVELPALPHAKRGALSERIDPREAFTREQLDWFNREFAAEFALYGYAPV
jgi:hypothetical protein